MSAAILPWSLNCGIFLLSVVVGVSILRKGTSSRNPRRLPYPPGPKKLPLLGNLFDLKGVNFGTLDYSNWAKKYGVFDFLWGEVLLIPLL